MKASDAAILIARRKAQVARQSGIEPEPVQDQSKRSRAPRQRIEEAHQRTLAEFLDWYVGPRKWFHPANERANEIERQILSELGVKSGISDVIIFKRTPCGRPGVVIELKAPDRKSASNPTAGATPDQLAMIQSFEEEGWICAVCYSVDEASTLVKRVYG